MTHPNAAARSYGPALEKTNHAKLMGAEPSELYEVRRRADSLAQNQLEESRQKEETIRIRLEDASACYRDGDFDCASTQAEAVLTMDGANTAAIEMQQTIKLARAQRLVNEKTVGNFLREAESCYQKRNYSCAMAMADSALAIIPNYAAARSMKNKAKSAQDRVKKSISIQ